VDSSVIFIVSGQTLLHLPETKVGYGWERLW